MALASFQKELLLGGKTNLVDDVKLFNTFKELARLMDYRSPDQFINDPMAVNEDGSPKYPAPQPQPDPKIMQLQMQAELNKQSDERKAQIEAVQAKADIETQNRKTDAEMMQSERDFQLKREMAILEFELQERLAMAEEARKQREHELKLEQQRQAHEYAVAKGEMAIMAGAQKAQQGGAEA